MFVWEAPLLALPAPPLPASPSPEPPAPRAPEPPAPVRNAVRSDGEVVYDPKGSLFPFPSDDGVFV